MINKGVIEHEIAELKKTKEMTMIRIEQLRKTAPEGYTLRAVKHGNTKQYFARKNSGENNGTYIKKKDRRIAEALAQLEYNEKLMAVLSNEIKELEKLRYIPETDPYMSALMEVTELKRELIDVPYMSDEEYRLKWACQTYDSLGFRDGSPEFYTKNELRVRSKSEVIIADFLDGFNIPFLYEKPLKLKSGQIVHPDFTLLNIKKREEILWEHLGMMDDIEYRNNAFMKVREYELNGYYQGLNLILTFETGKYPLNTKTLKNMIRDMADGLG
ncbi:MAG: hypothetical protein K5857_08635 [Lachnospiraceae bacterium]|nr:hypothetical protein [Lachnospiraceae bacterium]